MAKSRDQRLRPSYAECTEPSEWWRHERSRILGGDPDVVRARLERALRDGDWQLAQKRSGRQVHTAEDRRAGLQSALLGIAALTAEADERLAVRRFRDALTDVIASLRPAAAIAWLRVQELDRAFADRGARFPQKASADARRDFGRLNRVYLAEAKDFPERLIAFAQDVEAQRERLSEQAGLEGNATKTLVVEISRVLKTTGFTHAEIARLLDGASANGGAYTQRHVEARVEQRLRRARAQEVRDRKAEQMLLEVARERRTLAQAAQPLQMSPRETRRREKLGKLVTNTEDSTGGAQ